VNLSLLLDMAADGFGDRVVVGSASDGVTATRLRELALGGAEVVTAAGSDAIVYLAVNGVAFPVALFAAAAAGIPLVPVNFRLGADQLDDLLQQHPQAYAIADPAQHEALRRNGFDPVTPAEWLDCATKSAGTQLAVDSSAPAVIIYTSGTTSAPKGVLLHHDNLVSYVLGSVEFAGAQASDAALVSVPPYHIAAVANVISNLYAGRRLMTLEAFTPEEWLALVRTEGVTNALVVPTMLARIVAASDVDHDISSLRTLAYGGAAMPQPVIEKALRIWPDVDFVNAYGLTETSSTISVLGPEDHRAAVESDDPAVRARLGSAGKVTPAIEMEIRDESGQVVPPGVVGRIFVRGDQVSAEYAGSGPVVDARGFFDTRDEGLLDDEGYLFVKGRADDTIIRGAENIAPAEIEAVILAHEAVADVCVVGVPDEEWGQRIEAVAVLHASASVEPEALRAHVRERLRGSKTPDRIVFWTELPRTETGKLVRRQVVARLTSPSGNGR
jgi:acyl-CoA synthetase (AMP-forming)/AMP-acid ligase II